MHRPCCGAVGGCSAHALFNSLRQVAQGLGIMRPAAITYVAINAVNVVLNAGLMYGSGAR